MKTTFSIGEYSAAKTGEFTYDLLKRHVLAGVCNRSALTIDLFGTHTQTDLYYLSMLVDIVFQHHEGVMAIPPPPALTAAIGKIASQVHKEAKAAAQADYESEVRDAIESVQRELHRSRALFPFDRNTAHEGYAIALEEMDELWTEIKKKNPDACVLREESIQAAAMLVRFAVECC